MTSRLLGNLLDNAKEACAALSRVQPFIDLAINYQPDYLILHIANPFEAALKGSQRSIKADEENHGFGLENVEYLTEKHNGIFSIKQDNGFLRSTSHCLSNKRQFYADDVISRVDYEISAFFILKLCIMIPTHYVYSACDSDFSTIRGLCFTVVRYYNDCVSFICVR